MTGRLLLGCGLVLIGLGLQLAVVAWAQGAPELIDAVPRCEGANCQVSQPASPLRRHPRGLKCFTSDVEGVKCCFVTNDLEQLTCAGGCFRWP